MLKFLSACIFLALVSLCGYSGVVHASLERLDPGSIPVFHDDRDRASLKTAIAQSLTAFRFKNDAEMLSFGEQNISVARIRASLQAFLALLERGGNIQTALRRDFDIYRVSTPVLFTGYHEPLLYGSRVRTSRFRYPIYRRPDDLVDVNATATGGEKKQFGRMVDGKFAPYFSREEIDGKGVLRDKQAELLWVDDPISLFLLHVQGTGQVILPDGARSRVGYVASNGWPYTSIGKLLLEQGKLAPGEATTPAIRRYLQTHPTEQRALLFANARYIFFQLVPDGPRGSLGTPLTAGRSLATDPRIYPSGAVGFIRTKMPVVDTRNQVSWKESSRFVLFQDAGAAITGWRRADIFWGADAEDEAGLMAQEGEMYLLIKKP
ncbi:MAG: murein transglycosylase A [Candidatus Binatia bacterium]